MKKNFVTFSFLFIFFLMLAYPSVTKQAAYNGLQLWIFTVLPALLPYTIISSLLLSLNAFSYPCRILGHLLKRNIPQHEIFTIICGCLCGCPIGAKVAADSYKANNFNKEMAEFLMCAFNNISPSFLINYVFCQVYAPYIYLSITDKWILFAIMLVSSLLGTTFVHIWCSKFSYRKYSLREVKLQNICHSNTPALSSLHKKKSSIPTIFDDCILSSFEIHVKIGGYIILFTIINNLFLHTLPLNQLQSSILGSIMEVTSGLGSFITYKESNSVELLPLIPCVISALTSFGGLCTVLQTKTVIANTDLSISKYIASKILAGILAFMLTFLYMLYI